MTKARKTHEAPDGSLSTHNGFSLISNEKLLEIYATMLKCRMLEERIHSLSKPDGVASVHVAAIAGAAIDLDREDTLVPSQGAWAPCFAKGLPLSAIVASLTERKGSSRPPYASRNIVPPSLSTAKQFERALEAASGHKSKRSKKVVTVFSSDATAGELEEAMKLAGKKRLPILFVHEVKSGTDELIERAKQYGVPGVAVEDDDAVAVYRVSTEALTHARRGNGPTLIACRPWPYGENGAAKRRSAKHPISKMEAYLSSKGLYSRRFKMDVSAEFSRALDAAVNSARS